MAKTTLRIIPSKHMQGNEKIPQKKEEEKISIELS